MCLHSTTLQTPRPLSDTPSCPAKSLAPDQRQRLALEALAGTQPVAHLADEHAVSRKFVYQQADKAQQALHQAFTPNTDEPPVLFYLPITKPLLRQLVLGLVLICHSSFRGVVEFLRDLLAIDLSVGTVSNVVRSATAEAHTHNAHQDLSGVRVGAHDEIFQSAEPVLVGVDADSTYCYLLSQEEHRDGDTWGMRLLELKERGFQPEATIADAGAGLRAGQKAALSEVPCRGDVFHIVYEFGKVVRYLESLAYQTMQPCLDLQRQLVTPGKRRDRHKQSLAVRLGQARRQEAEAVALYDDVAVLLRWLQEDILSVAGPDYATRQELLAFVVAELRLREPRGPKGIKEMSKALANQGASLLAFVLPLEEALAALAAAWSVPVAALRELLAVQRLSEKNPRRWQEEALLRARWRGRYHAMSRIVSGLSARVVRASSVAENLNSRLRGYFFLRRELGSGYLSLLQFFLNHRRFPRSARKERVGKSPTELLTGQSHPHWLEMLGYQRFAWN